MRYNKQAIVEYVLLLEEYVLVMRHSLHSLSLVRDE